MQQKSRRFDVEDVLDYGASTVVIATGANWDGTGTSPMTHTPVPGADAHQGMVFTPEDVMVEKRTVDGSRVLVYDCDGYFMGSSLAQKLAIEGKEVTLVTPTDQIGSYLFHTDEGGHVMHALLELGVELVTSHALTRIEPGRVTGHNVYHEAIETSWTVDAVVLVTQRRSRNDLYEQLTTDPERLSAAEITHVLRIGDCVEPRVIAEAVFDGHRLGREIDTSDPATPLPFIREQRILGWREEDYDGVLRHVLPLTPVSRTTRA